jgi:hypothetical protein
MLCGRCLLDAGDNIVLENDLHVPGDEDLLRTQIDDFVRVKGSIIWPDCQSMLHSDRNSVSGLAGFSGTWILGGRIVSNPKPGPAKSALPA